MEAPGEPTWRRRGLLAGLAAAGLLLGWAVVTEAASRSLPRPTALGVNPGSPSLLARQAEAEFKAGRVDQAIELSRRSIRKTPFNVRALRVLGLGLAQRGEGERAEQIVTLAGNWSLRDTAAHLWLADERLRRADFGSGVPHLDAVLRRREDLRPTLFDLLGRAARSDPRALAEVSKRLALNPNWREDFIPHLLRTSDGQAAAMALAVSLHGAGKGFSNDELSDVFTALAKARKFQAVRMLAAELDLHDPSSPLADGDFNGVDRPLPLRWDLIGGSGATVEVVAGDSGPTDRVLRIEYDGYSSPSLIRQMVLLPPGRYVLEGRMRGEGAPERLNWRVRCAEGGALLSSGTAARPGAAGDGWRAFAQPFTVSEARCDAQLVELAPRPGEHRETVVTWYDDLRIRTAL